MVKRFSKKYRNKGRAFNYLQSESYVKIVSSSTKLRQLSRSTGCKADSCRSVSDTLVTGCHKPALSETQANDKDVGSRQ